MSELGSIRTQFRTASQMPVVVVAMFRSTTTPIFSTPQGVTRGILISMRNAGCLQLSKPIKRVWEQNFRLTLRSLSFENHTSSSSKGASGIFRSSLERDKMRRRDTMVDVLSGDGGFSLFLQGRYQHYHQLSIKPLSKSAVTVCLMQSNKKIIK